MRHFFIFCPKWDVGRGPTNKWLVVPKIDATQSFTGDERMTTELGLFKAANGHMSLECGDLPDSYWQSIVEVLEKEEGFVRSGRPVLGAGEMIHQDFVSESFTLSAG